MVDPTNMKHPVSNLKVAILPNYIIGFNFVSNDLLH